MVLLRVDNDIFNVEFKQGISLNKREPTFFYGCPIHQIKAENYCPECEKPIKAERIYVEEPIQKVKLNDIKGIWTENFPLYAMVENGFGWVLSDEKLIELMKEKKQLITFKFIEKNGLNAKELDNFLFLYQNHLARIRCDLENKSLIGFDFANMRKEVRKRTVNVLKKKVERINPSVSVNP